MTSATTVFITGANTGLGLYTVKALYESPRAYNILLGSRDLRKAVAAIEEVKCGHAGSTSSIEPVQIDLEDDTSIA